MLFEVFGLQMNYVDYSFQLESKLAAAFSHSPLTMAGCRSSLSHPLKLHLRPEVQKKRMRPLIILRFTNSFSSLSDTDCKESFRIHLPGLYGHEVHAVAAADVPSGHPVYLQVLCKLVLPREEVVVPSE